MTTIYASIECTMLDGLVDKVLRMEFYSTSAVAHRALSQWAIDGWFNENKWTLSAADRWECLVNDELHVLLVEEHVVFDTVQRKETAIISDYSPSLEPYKSPSDCAHDNCGACGGTGHKPSGERCIHSLSCTCAKCNPYYD